MSHSTLNIIMDMFFKISNKSFDHLQSNLLDMVLKKYIHKQFGSGSIWLRLSPAEAESEMPHAIKDTGKTCCLTLCSLSPPKKTSSNPLLRCSIRSCLGFVLVCKKYVSLVKK